MFKFSSIFPKHQTFIMVNGNAFTDKYYFLSIAKTVFNLKKIVGCLVKKTNQRHRLKAKTKARKNYHVKK